MTVRYYRTDYIDPPNPKDPAYAQKLHRKAYRLFLKRHKIIAKACKEAEKNGWKYWYNNLGSILTLEVHIP